MVVLLSAWWAADNSGWAASLSAEHGDVIKVPVALQRDDIWSVAIILTAPCTVLITQGSSTIACKIHSSCCSYIAWPSSHLRLCRHCVPDTVVLLQKYLCLWLWRRTSPVSFPRIGGYSIAPSGTESCLRTGAALVTGKHPLSLVSGDHPTPCGMPFCVWGVCSVRGSAVHAFYLQLLKLFRAFSTCSVWKNLFLVVAIALEMQAVIWSVRWWYSRVW